MTEEEQKGKYCIRVFTFFLTLILGMAFFSCEKKAESFFILELAKGHYTTMTPAGALEVTLTGRQAATLDNPFPASLYRVLNQGNKTLVIFACQVDPFGDSDCLDPTNLRAVLKPGEKMTDIELISPGIMRLGIVILTHQQADAYFAGNNEERKILLNRVFRENGLKEIN